MIRAYFFAVQPDDEVRMIVYFDAETPAVEVIGQRHDTADVKVMVNKYKSPLSVKINPINNVDPVFRRVAERSIRAAAPVRRKNASDGFPFADAIVSPRISRADQNHIMDYAIDAALHMILDWIDDEDDDPAVS